VLGEVEGPEGEELARAAEGLDLVDPDGDPRIATAFHQRREELARRRLDAALALHQLEQHGGHPSRIADQVGVECSQAAGDRVGIAGLVERNRKRASP
jgi:hypothetical protein